MCSGNLAWYRKLWRLHCLGWLERLQKSKNLFAEKDTHKKADGERDGNEEKRRPIVFGTEKMANKSRAEKYYAILRIIYLANVYGHKMTEYANAECSFVPGV